jgi:hypothetical protein
MNTSPNTGDSNRPTGRPTARATVVHVLTTVDARHVSADVLPLEELQ